MSQGTGCAISDCTKGHCKPTPNPPLPNTLSSFYGGFHKELCAVLRARYLALWPTALQAWWLYREKEVMSECGAQNHAGSQGLETNWALGDWLQNIGYGEASQGLRLLTERDFLLGVLHLNSVLSSCLLAVTDLNKLFGQMKANSLWLYTDADLYLYWSGTCHCVGYKKMINNLHVHDFICSVLWIGYILNISVATCGHVLFPLVFLV